MGTKCDECTEKGQNILEEASLEDMLKRRIVQEGETYSLVGRNHSRYLKREVGGSLGGI